jgi:putative salt-induced outer membrane protein YdiY
MKKTITILSLLIASQSSHAITNIEFARGEAEGKDFFSLIESEYAGESGNNTSSRLTSSAVIAWQDKTSQFITMLNHTWKSHENKIVKNNSFFHIRYTKEFGEESGNHLEYFLQGKQDSFRNIESRVLAGIGFRKTLMNEANKRFNAFGVGAMYESEHSTKETGNIEKDLWRGALYWHHKQPLKPNVFVENVVYLQPSLRDIKDIRIGTETRLTTQVTKNISVGFKLSYSYDSEPIIGIKKYDANYSTFAKYSF